MKGVCVSWGGGVLRENGHLALHIGECDGCACVFVCVWGGSSGGNYSIHKFLKQSPHFQVCTLSCVLWNLLPPSTEFFRRKSSPFFLILLSAGTQFVTSLIR